jgi:hypothetical protein
MAVPSVSLIMAMLARSSSGHDFDCGHEHRCSGLAVHHAAVGRVTAMIPRARASTRWWTVECLVECFKNDGGDIMVRKITIALAAVAFASAMAAATTADARMGGGIGPRGGGFGGAGMRGAVMGGGGFRGAMVGGGVRSAMVGGGFRTAGMRSAFVGPRSVAFRPGFARPVNRFAFNRFHHRRFAFAAVPFAVGAGYYGGSCWTWQPTRWGWQQVWACGYDYY